MIHLEHVKDSFKINSSTLKLGRINYEHDEAINSLTFEKLPQSVIISDSQYSFRVIKKRPMEIIKNEENVILESFSKVGKGASALIDSAGLAIAGVLLSIKIALICIVIYLIIRCVKENTAKKRLMTRLNQQKQ